MILADSLGPFFQRKDEGGVPGTIMPSRSLAGIAKNLHSQLSHQEVDFLINKEPLAYGYYHNIYNYWILPRTHWL